MAGKKILTKKQKQFLELFSRSVLAKQFYFTGGTALSYIYLQHRFSEDLDFFSEKEIDLQAVNVFIKLIQKDLKYKSLDIKTAFNRNIFMLRFDKKNFLKIEFTYYPFPQIKKPVKKYGLLIDSLLDIGVNKLFTINQKPRGRDYFDLFFIVKKEKITMDKLRLLAKQKFDWHVDRLQLGMQLSRVGKLLDDPILIKRVNKKELVDFFVKEAVRFKEEII